MVLTHRQEAFALNLFHGMTQREAWKKAGYTDRYRDEWIDSQACRLANSVKIMSRLEQLRAKAIDKSIADVVERRQRLTTLARVEMQGGKVMPRDVVTAIQELNKMDGVYPNEKKVADALTDIVFVIGQGYKTGDKREI